MIYQKQVELTAKLAHERRIPSFWPIQLFFFRAFRLITQKLQQFVIEGQQQCETFTGQSHYTQSSISKGESLCQITTTPNFVFSVFLLRFSVAGINQVEADGESITVVPG